MSKLAVDFAMPLEEGQNAYWQNAQAAAEAIKQAGFPQAVIPMIPDGRGGEMNLSGQLPQDLTNLTDDQLGWWLNYISMWSEYTQNKLAEAEMNMNTAETELDFVEAELRLSYKFDESRKKRTEGERKDMMRIDKRYIEAKRRSLYFEGIYRYTRAVANAAERNWNTISRRITQRGQDLERHRRDQGVGSITMPFRRG